MYRITFFYRLSNHITLCLPFRCIIQQLVAFAINIRGDHFRFLNSRDESGLSVLTSRYERENKKKETQRAIRIPVEPISHGLFCCKISYRRRMTHLIAVFFDE